MNHDATYAALEGYLRETRGLQLKVIRKRSSPLMWVIAFFLLPFNRRFMSGYTTTFAGRMWVPDDVDAESKWRTLAHEGWHLEQEKVVGWWKWKFLYLFPQVFAFAAIGAIAAIWWTPALWCLLALVFAAPWPAPWRVKYEREAYAVTATVDGARGITITSPTYIDFQVEHHCGWGYYKPAWRRDAMRKRVQDDIVKASRALVRERYLLRAGLEQYMYDVAGIARAGMRAERSNA